MALTRAPGALRYGAGAGASGVAGMRVLKDAAARGRAWATTSACVSGAESGAAMSWVQRERAALMRTRAFANAPAKEATSAKEKPEEASVFGGVSQTVGELVSSKSSSIRTCTENQYVIEAVKTMVANNIGSLIVVRDDKPIGIVTERDYLEKVIVLGRHSDSTKVSEIMSTKGLVSVPPSAQLNECMDLMATKHVTHIPVIENDEVLGLVSIGDVVKGLVKSYHEQHAAMNEYIAGSY
eukprot:CAMPEP_0185842488 /NCGR_PEP_ID=MMETSP1353-20130828/18434_1 /TAXON_ID=1077150 /ORGANISM="Erythrolobus australicus, Strain CCMP3124" /LENGTH=238 /DNA_ID=CAMNT_0028541991 /DNA_START=51 /DNA_END=767 /DNA_ORIENTATION=+